MKVWVAVWDNTDPTVYATRELLMEAIDPTAFLEDPDAQVSETFISLTDYVYAIEVEVKE